jgi:hypothetical protein
MNTRAELSQTGRALISIKSPPDSGGLFILNRDWSDTPVFYRGDNYDSDVTFLSSQSATSTPMNGWSF